MSQLEAWHLAACILITAALNLPAIERALRVRSKARPLSSGSATKREMH